MYGSDPTVTTTLASLVTMVQQCLHIETITLPVLDIRTSSLPPLNALPRVDGGGKVQVNVEEYIRDDTTDLYAFAVVVDQIFPALDVP